MYHTLISILALSKISLGASGILAPSLINQALLLNVPSSSLILTHLFASRELALGGILWVNRLRKHPSPPASSASLPMKSAPAPMTSTTTAPTTPTMMGLRQALLFGVAADSLDALSAALCFTQGTLDWKSALLVGGGGALVAGWGGFCLKGVGRLAAGK